MPGRRLTWRTRRILSLVLLLVWLPPYVVVAITVVGWFERPHALVEVGVYAGLGFLWALPFRRVFRGIGRADPADPERPEGE